MKKLAQTNNDLFRSKPKYPKKKLKLSLPLGISVNSLYTYFRGKRQISAKARQYMVEAIAMINLAIDEQNWSEQKPYTWLYMDIVFYFKDRKVRDSHNYLKLLCDCIQATSIIDNDYYLIPRIHSVELDKENPRMDIVISAQTKADREVGMKMCK